MHPILFKIGPITFYTYGFFVFIGVLAGYFVCLKLAEKDKIGKKAVSDIIFWTLVLSFIGARVFYIIVEFNNFLLDPMGLIFSRSGFVFYGGVVFGIAALYLLTKRNKIPFFKFADILVVGTCLAHAFGRLGCFSYGCCYGRPSNSFIAMLFPPDSPAGFLGVKVIPAQLIESGFLFILFFLLLFLKRHKKFDGQIFIYYVVFYGLFRFLIEFFRADPRGSILFLSVSQAISVVLIGLGAFLWVKSKRQK